MLFQYRNTKVFVAALVSIGIGAVVLRILGSNPIPAGAFSLSEYYHLEPVEKVISANAVKASSHWNSIEISYSDSKAGNIKQLAALDGLANPEDINCHFVICNGLGGGDGQIQPTEKWRRQWSIAPARASYGSERTIRICVIADNKSAYPTDFQVKRVESMVEVFSRTFDIGPALIYYPDNWR